MEIVPGRKSHTGTADLVNFQNKIPCTASQDIAGSTLRLYNTVDGIYSRI